MTVTPGGEKTSRRRKTVGGPQPSAEDLSRIEALYDAGRLYDAYRATQPFAPLREWRGTDAIILAGRLAHQLGANRTADALMMFALRREPAHPKARYYSVHTTLRRRGPLDALDLMDRFGDAVADQTDYAEWMALRAQVLGQFRDFSAADACIDEAKRIAPRHPWIALEAADLLRAQDRHADALAEARRALSLKANHHGATIAVAHLLVLLGRDDEAMAMLTDGLQTIQSGTIAGFLASLLTARGRYQEALEACQLSLLYRPLADAETRASVYGHLSHLQYLVGNIEESKRLAIESGDPVLARYAGRLSAAPLHKRRIQLDVPFIQQHYVTCVPTTMAMIGRYWKRDIEHLSVADQITYGGTSAFRERAWAEANGWTARELTLSWDAAVALLDRGVPFALTTTWIGGGHEQAVIGYDTHRRSLLIRDPSSPMIAEVDADGMIEHQAADGPRAMVLIPNEQAALLDGIALPEARERDEYHRLTLALERNDRAAAGRHAQTLETHAAGSRMALHARLALANYDRNGAAALDATNALLVLFPNDSGLSYSKSVFLQELSRRQERVDLLEACVEKGEDPMFLRILAEALNEDGAHHARAAALIRRFLRMAPVDAEGLRVLGLSAWAANRPDEAARIMRFASCVADTDESLASAYFMAASSAGKQDEALALLQDRFQRFASRSGSPARTLFWALSQMQRINDGLDVLRRAIALRGDDGQLLLMAGGAYAKYGKQDEAAELLRRAEQRTRRSEFAAAIGALRSHRGDLAGALSAWRKVFELDPLSPDAHQAIRDLLLQTDGPAMARRFLEHLVARFPEYQPAHTLLIDDLRADGDLQGSEAALRRLLAIAPRDAGAWRMRAQVLAHMGRIEEALAACQRAAEIAPHVSSNEATRGQVLLLGGRFAEAREQFRRAIEMDPDEEYAYYGLVRACTTMQDRTAALREQFPSIVERTVSGEAMPAFHAAARDVFDRAELLAMLEQAAARRPTLWQARGALIRQLLMMGRDEEAAARANDALQRFPFEAGLNLIAATAFARAGSPQRQRTCIETAIRINPTSASAALAYADLLRSKGETERAASAVQIAATRSPLDADAQRALAEVLWEKEKRGEAVDRLIRAVRLAPNDEGLWARLREWAGDRALTLARELTKERPFDGNAWIALAVSEDDAAAKLAAIDKAISIERWNEQAHSLKIDFLVDAERFDDALVACTALGDNYVMRGRSALIWAQRGDLERALTILKKVLQGNPLYTWGWFQLAQWSEATGDKETHLSAAKELARLDPAEPSAWNELASAEFDHGNIEAAEKHSRKALQLDPSDVRAGITLVDLFIEQQRMQSARDVLAELAKVAVHPFIPDRQIRIERISGTVEQALKALAKLIEFPDVDRLLVQDALGRIREMEPGARLSAMLKEAMKKPTPAGVALTIDHLVVDHDNWDEALRMFEQAKKTPAALFAGKRLLEFIGVAGEGAVLDRFLSTSRDWARQDDITWAYVGYAYRTSDRSAEAVKWMSDWQKREALPWMLATYAIALRTIGREADAAKIHAHALKLPEEDTTDCHRTWVGFDAARAGQIDAAQRARKDVDGESLDVLHRVISALAEVMIEAALWPKVWKTTAEEYLITVVNTPLDPYDVPVVRICYDQTVAALQQKHGGITSAMWAMTWKGRSKLIGSVVAEEE